MFTYEIYTMSYSRIIQADSIMQALEKFYSDGHIDIVYAIFDIKSSVGKSILKKL